MAATAEGKRRDRDLGSCVGGEESAEPLHEARCKNKGDKGSVQGRERVPYLAGAIRRGVYQSCSSSSISTKPALQDCQPGSLSLSLSNVNSLQCANSASLFISPCRCLWAVEGGSRINGGIALPCSPQSDDEYGLGICRSVYPVEERTGLLAVLTTVSQTIVAATQSS